jgi:hypothetical protein
MLIKIRNRQAEMLNPLYICSKVNLPGMTNHNAISRYSVVISIIAAGALFRFIPHWPNFTPVAAIALFGGAYAGRKYLAFLIPFAAMFLSDLVLGFHAYMGAVYLAFGLTVMIGLLLRGRTGIQNVVMASLSSSVLFYLITNFSAWLASPLYPNTFTGLMESYIAGLAFFNNGSLGLSFFLNEVAGTLFYSGIFFGVYAVAKQRMPALAR